MGNIHFTVPTDPNYYWDVSDEEVTKVATDLYNLLLETAPKWSPNKVEVELTPSRQIWVSNDDYVVREGDEINFALPNSTDELFFMAQHYFDYVYDIYYEANRDYATALEILNNE